MSATLLLFGLGLGFVYTMILMGLFGLSFKPKWLLVALIPAILSGIRFLLGNTAANFSIFAGISLVFLMAITGIIYSSIADAPRIVRSKNKKDRRVTYGNIVLLSGLLGILYQLYVLVVILSYILNAPALWGSREDYTGLIRSLQFQVGSAVFILLLSAIFIAAARLKQSDRWALLSWTRVDLSRFQVYRPSWNRLVGYAFGLLMILLFFKTGEQNGWFVFLKNFGIVSFKAMILNMAVLFFLGYNLLFLAIDPKNCAKANMQRILLLLRSAYFGLFAAAALIPFFILASSKNMELNLNSEIILFLGLNLVLLITEIILFLKISKHFRGPIKKATF
ncbi:hypothetical protein [Niabella sp.]|uniref:hypothetical protein n=1 Tax=Niabella sp. TaxID=1962976 RepID=UPI00262918D8|nr:hypothetical protein [Niabella sp.]